MRESLHWFLEQGIKEWNEKFANDLVTVQIQESARYYYEVFKVSLEDGVKDIGKKKLLFTSKIKEAKCEFEFFFSPETETDLYKEILFSNYRFEANKPFKLALDSKAEIGSFFRDYIWSVSPGS